MNAIQHGDSILANLHKSLEFSLKYGDTDDANKDKYNDLAKSVCKLEHGFMLGHDIVKEAAKQATVESFDQVLEDQRNESQPKFKAQTSKRYLDFMKKTQRMIDVESAESSQSTQANDSMDFDDAHSGEVISDIDPITKTQLVHPVRNKHCNHIYGYNSVMQLLQQNPRLRCPIVGCANKQFVTIADLVEDEELAERLDRQRKKQKQKH